MKILFLTPQLPYPAVSGGLIKTLKLIEYLSSDHDIEVGFFVKNESEIVRKDLHDFHEKTKVKFFYKVLDIERSGLNFIKSLIQRLPLSVFRNLSEEFINTCKLRSEECDLIFIDHFLMFQYVPQDWTKEIFLHQHNAEFIMWERYSETQSNIIKKIVIKLEAKRIKNYERMIIQKATTVFASPNDIEILTKISTREINFIETLHLGEEYLLNEPTLQFNETDFSILYVGTLTWEANRDGLVWFLKNIWPHLKSNFPKLIFKIIGKDNDPNLFSSWADDNQIIWYGFVDDLKPHYDSSRVFVAPLNFGSGIKVKVINALYRGIPTVTTAIGVEGLVLNNEVDIYFSNSAEVQVKYISELLTNDSTWKKVSISSRRKALELYSWESVLSKINKAINHD
ncbi:MAG: glycosyltransferase [Bacteriovorax sp.]|nr:glycosyltransferase [Bacteriovorax sp.]